MLVLKRTKGKKITLFKDGIKLCEITALDVEAGSSKDSFRMKLGFDAPDEVKIYRNELLEDMERADAKNKVDDSGSGTSSTAADSRAA